MYQLKIFNCLPGVMETWVTVMMGYTGLQWCIQRHRSLENGLGICGIFLSSTESLPPLQVLGGRSSFPSPRQSWKFPFLIPDISRFLISITRHTPELSLTNSLDALILVPLEEGEFESMSLRESLVWKLRPRSDEFSVSPLLPLAKEKQCSNTEGHHTANPT